MTVERYSDAHFSSVVELVRNFHSEALGAFDADFSPEVIIDLIHRENPANAFLLIVEGTCQGLLYGMKQTSRINKKLMFQEIMWYVNPAYRRYGVNLLKEVEKQLKSEGVSIMIMAVLENSKTEKIKRLYERMGYKPMETNYVRAL